MPNLCIIPARGGSKRIPRKNIRDFCGKPMIAHSIVAAQQSNIFDHIVVSTDDEKIAHIARDFGAEVPFLRPAELADDQTATVPVIRQGIVASEKAFIDNDQKFDFVCCLYATAPLVQPTDINRGYEILKEAPSLDFAFSVCEFGFPIQRALRLTEKGCVAMFNPEHEQTRSQDLEPAYQDCGQFYWGTRQAWLKKSGIYSANSQPVMIPRHRVQDIDTEEDWLRAEIIWKTLNQK